MTKSQPYPLPELGGARFSRRRMLQALATAPLAALLPGCGDRVNTMGRLERVWGRRGGSNGRFQKPRAMAIDDQDRIYIVDMTARIQVFDTEGKFLYGWQTPEKENGKPTGLSVGSDGNVLVADTHYYRVLVCAPGKEVPPERRVLRTIGGTFGREPGQFDLVRDAVQDRQGHVYVSESGECDRIQKFTSDGKFLLEWGGHGSDPGQLVLPQSLAIDQQNRVWVADACNHRIQVFDTEGNLIDWWGTEGRAAGQLYYPYDVVLAPDGSVYVCEFGNNRIQRFTRDGQSLGCWGTHGRGEGQLNAPWALVCDRRGRIHVLDTNNHRVHKVRV